MPTASDPLGAKQGETIEQHKSRVVAASQAHAEAQKVAARASTTRPPDGYPKPPGTPSNIPDFMKDMGVEEPKINEGNTSEPTGSSKTQNPPTSGNWNPNNEPEWQKVAREKGWKTPMDAVNSYLNLEVEFHNRNQQRPPQAPSQVPAYTPQPVPYQRPQEYAFPYPQTQWPYQPVPPVAPQNIARQLGGKYGISVEDSERLLPYVAEVAQAAAENALVVERSRTQPMIQGLQREVNRNREINEIANDPAMRNPRVQFEVNKVLSDNPSVYANEPQPLRWALERALRNIAQESLGTNPLYGGVPGYPTTPPVTAGSGAQTRGGAPTGTEPSVDLAGNYFKLKTSAEKLEVLKTLGVASQT